MAQECQHKSPPQDLNSPAAMTLIDFFNQHKKITRSLRKFIQNYENELSGAVFSSFLSKLSEELTSAQTDIFSEPAGPLRAKKLQKLVDHEITTNDAHIKASCQKGCSACCHMEVEITNYEADVLAKLINTGVDIDRNRLQEQSQRALQDPLWREGRRNSFNPCVFLDSNGACRIYEERPVMCRRHSVTSSPQNCDTLTSQITVRYFPKVDLLISAANEDPLVEIGPLAKMLQMRLQQKQTN